MKECLKDRTHFEGDLREIRGLSFDLLWRDSRANKVDEFVHDRVETFGHAGEFQDRVW